MARKAYTGPLIDVTDDRDLCIHSTVCVQGMAAVFDTSRRPWIDPRVADTPDLAEQLRAVVGRTRPVLCESRSIRGPNSMGREEPAHRLDRLR